MLLEKCQGWICAEEVKYAFEVVLNLQRPVPSAVGIVLYQVRGDGGYGGGVHTWRAPDRGNRIRNGCNLVLRMGVEDVNPVIQPIYRGRG